MTSLDRSTWGPSSIFVGEDLGVPLASLGVFATGYYIGYVVSISGGGILTDKFGGRTIIAVSLVGAGSFMFVFGSTTSAVIGILVQGTVGLFAGAEYAAGIKLISSWFKPHQLGKVMGIYTSAVSLGVVIANTAVPALIDLYGWTASYHVFGVVSVIVGIVCYVVLRPGPIVTRSSRAAGKSTFRTLVGNKNLVLLALAGFGGFWGAYGFITWSNALIIKGHGIDPAVAGGIVALYAALGVLGKPIMGWVSDYFNASRRVPAMIVYAVFAVTLLIFGLMNNATAFLIVAPLLGLGASCFMPLMVALVPRLVGSEMIGTAAGFMSGFWQLGSVLVPLAVGGVFALTGQSFFAAFATLAAGPAVAILFMYFVNERPADVAVETKD
ncbi:MFS transporter (plasmid) [Arthrobacter sp. D2-10]